MKILSIGNFGHGWDGSICDEEHIARELEYLGHEVIRGQRGQENVYISPNQRPYDFVLIAQWDGYHPDFVENTRRELNEGKTDKPTPIVYWAFDYQADGQEWHERLVKEADLYLSKRIADSKYPNWRWLSQDFAPNFLQPKPDWHHSTEQDIDVLFTGSYLPWATERNETLREVNEKYNLVIHSVNAWPEEWGLDVRPPIMDDGLPELYARAKVILSIDHTIEAGYWSDRNAQILACGKRPLFRYVPLSEFRFGDRVDYFYDAQGCIEQIAERLDNYEPPEKADMSNLYVEDRVRDLLTIVEGIL